MDISILDKTSIRIHSKLATFVFGQVSQGAKVSCDAVILPNNGNQANPGENIDISRLVDYHIVVDGPGEYEVNGVKILGVKVDKGFVYCMTADGFSVIFGKTSEVSKLKDDTFFCQVIILNADDEINSSIITKLEPKIVILYGDNKEKAAKILGKENIPPIKKLSILKDKLPEEMEVVVLASSN